MSTTLKLGWTNPITGAFGDHPALGTVFDLDDGVTFTLATPDGLALQPPPRTVIAAGNIRTRGERATRAIYRHDRQAVARVIVGPMASYADLAANVRALVAWLNAPPAVPFCIQYQPIGASLPVYLDVVACAHTIPEDEGQWLRLQFEPVEIVFVCRPGLRGDRVILQNLVVNPGFEAPSGPGVQVFSDTFTSANAYTVAAGSISGPAANVLTLNGSSAVQFGSPAWSAVQTWQIRFQTPNGGAVINPFFGLHGSADLQNMLGADVSSTALRIRHRIGGTEHIQASAAITLANATWYWLKLTQFPSVAGDPPYLTATLYNDNAGALGAQVAAVSAAAYDAVTALTGKPIVWANNTNSMAIGGAYAGVHALSLFGPGGWQTGSGYTIAPTGVVSAAWDGALSERGMSGTGGGNTYASSPVTSFGAARLDFPPAGSADGFVNLYTIGGQLAGSSAMPVAAAGNVLGVSVWVKSAGLGANARLVAYLRELDSGGTYLRQTAVQTLSGNQASWTQLSGSVTTAANCAYADLLIEAYDSTAGSASGTVWIDDAQVWNVTTTGLGVGSMPWCQLRMPQSPCELVVSGLLGDLPAPAYLAWGTWLASWPAGSSLSFAVGRRNGVNPTARLVGPPVGFYGTALSPTSVCALDSHSYGGYYIQATVTASGWNPRFLSATAADVAGLYHLFNRFLTQQAAGNLGNVNTTVAVQQRSQPWYGDTAGFTDEVGTYYGPATSPIKQSNVWTVADSGQVPIPFAPAGALTDPTQLYYTPRGQWGDGTPGGSTCQASWQMLLPVDGSLLVGALNNPANAPFAVTNEWLWCYLDGLLTNRGSALDGPSWLYSLEAGPSPNPARGGGSVGTSSTGTINVNSGADPYLVLDPTLQASGQSAGVNQLAAYVADQAGAVLPFYGEIAYSPLYLYPR